MLGANASVDSRTGTGMAEHAQFEELGVIDGRWLHLASCMSALETRPY